MVYTEDDHRRGPAQGDELFAYVAVEQSGSHGDAGFSTAGSCDSSLKHSVDVKGVIRSSCMTASHREVGDYQARSSVSGLGGGPQYGPPRQG
jgi:hypothetical protein